MCGIAGFVDLSGKQDTLGMKAILGRMTDALVHRGPDSQGAWAEHGVGLGFRRLAILDLSPTGSQPMASACGRYQLIFNGEIYNFRQLRQEVEATKKFPYSYRGRSDTEVLLSAFTVWGIEESLRRANGMFAMAVWDRELRTVTLARDRLGEKPLYYGWGGKTFLFGSELKALRRHPDFLGEIDRDALSLFFRFSYLPAPHTIYRGVFKLPPASLLTLHVPSGEVRAISSYWSAKEATTKLTRSPFRGSLEDARDELDALVRDAVKIRMEADVPLGAFLSGGVDSSTIVAIMQAQSSLPVKTFTMGFAEAEYDEAKFAKAVAQHLGTDHVETTVTPRDALDVVPLLPRLYDEPFADSSQIPTYLVSKIARQQVTVSLSGDGGDELFGGYHRHTWGKSAWQMLKSVPSPLKAAMARGLSGPSPAAWNVLFDRMEPILPKRFRMRNPGEKLQKLSQALQVKDPEELYLRLITQWVAPTELVLGAREPKTIFTDPSQWPDIDDFSEEMMYLDLVTYLPDDILVKVDRASMGVSLEARVPFLDHRVVEFAWTLPLEMKIRDRETKRVLRRVLDKYVPRQLIERPKMGFGLPVDHWLRGPLKDWAAALIKPSRLATEGFLNGSLIEKRWLEHQSGERNWQAQLWSVLMFQAWLEETSQKEKDAELPRMPLA